MTNQAVLVHIDIIVENNLSYHYFFEPLSLMTGLANSNQIIGNYITLKEDGKNIEIMIENTNNMVKSEV